MKVIISAHSFRSFRSYFAPLASMGALNQPVSITTGIALVLFSAACLLEASVKLDGYVSDKARMQAAVAHPVDGGGLMLGAIDFHVGTAVPRGVVVERIHEIQPPASMMGSAPSMMRSADGLRTLLARAGNSD